MYQFFLGTDCLNCLSLTQISKSDNYIKVISAMQENNIDAVKVGCEINIWLGVVPEYKQGWILSLFLWIILMSFVAEEHREGIRIT